MELTGKCKEDFEAWYVGWVRNLRNDYHKFTNDTLLRKFYREVDSMRFGVYVDFFDSKNIFISIESVFDRMLGYNRGFQIQIYQDGKNPITLFNEYQDAFNTRKEAQFAAIEKANELYNNQP